MKSTGSTPDKTLYESGASAALPFHAPESANGSLSFLPGKRVLVIAGHYGSGKTELALNLAIALKPSSAQLALIDLDIVNPFFRSAEQERMLSAHGVEVFMPLYANTGVDIPSLPPDILSVFVRDDLRAIFDVGGDDAGAAALGAYAPQFERVEKAFFMVVNPFRPRSETVDQITGMYEAIARRARMKPDAFVANPNVGDTTTIEDILEGLAITREAAKACGVPVSFLCVREGLAGKTPDMGLPVFPMRRYLKPEWMEV